MEWKGNMHILTMCVKNIFRKRVRTSLCITGFSLCIMLIVSVSSTTNFAMYFIESSNLFYRGKIVVVSKNSYFIQIAPIGSALLEKIGEQIEEIEGVKTAVPAIFVYSISPKKRFLPTNITVGIPYGKWDILTGPLKPDKGGRWPENNSKEVVVGRYLADYNNLTIGSKITIRGVNFTVVGILSPGLSSILSYMIIMPLKVAQEVYGYRGIVHMFIVEPIEGVSEEELAERIEEKIANVDALTTNERNQLIQPLLNDFRKWSTAIEIFSFIIGSFFIIVLSLINVYERRREIAIIDSIGAAKHQLIIIIVLEVVFLCLIGGAIGTVLGLLSSFIMLRWLGKIAPKILLEHLWIVINFPMLLNIFITLLAMGTLLGLILATGMLRKGTINILREEI